MTPHEFRHQYYDGRRDFTGISFDRGPLEHERFAACDFSNGSFKRAGYRKVGFDGCNFSGTTWTSVELGDTDFERCNLSGCSFIDATFSRTRFYSCLLSSVKFHEVEMRDCDLRDCNGSISLWNVTLDDVGLLRCNFDHVRLGRTILVGSAIQDIIDAVDVTFESTVTVDWLSICRSVTALGLERFLMRSGMPEVFMRYSIDSARSLDPGLLFSLMHSTFISYGGPDTTFARKLRDALLRNGVRTYLFGDDAVPGELLHRVMRDGISSHDRVVLVCSRASLDRSGVQNEIELTLGREARDGGVSYLIPVILDDYVFGWTPARAHLAQALRERVVADFRGTDTDGGAPLMLPAHRARPGPKVTATRAGLSHT